MKVRYTSINNNISFEGLKMSVIIQEMVNSEYSGICFTINPISGNDKEMLIEVSKGLGENIVSGKTKPEQYYYNWYDNIYEVNENNKYLSEDMVKKIGITFFEIMKYFGYPCDIEFVVRVAQVMICGNWQMKCFGHSTIFKALHPALKLETMNVRTTQQKTPIMHMRS